MTDNRLLNGSEQKRNLDAAFHFARVIQNQKDWETQILSSIERLLDFPSAGLVEAKDAVFFARSVEAFVPTNFDDLIEERRIDEKCGYALCSKPPRALTTPANIAGKASTRDRTFCGVACAKKAVFVKAQLLDVPVWERLPGQNVTIALPEPEQQLIGMTNADALAGAHDKHAPSVTDLKELAAERGEDAASVRPQQVMTDFVVEKRISSKTPQLAPDGDVGVPGSVEGYHPKQTYPNKRAKYRRAEAIEGGKAADHDGSDDEDDYDSLTDLAKDVYKQLGSN